MLHIVQPLSGNSLLNGSQMKHIFHQNLLLFSEHCSQVCRDVFPMPQNNHKVKQVTMKQSGKLMCNQQPTDYQ